MWGAKYETFVAGLVSGEGSQLICVPTWFMLCYSNICSVYVVSLGHRYYLLRNLHSRGWLWATLCVVGFVWVSSLVGSENSLTVIKDGVAWATSRQPAFSTSCSPWWSCVYWLAKGRMCLQASCGLLVASGSVLGSSLLFHRAPGLASKRYRSTSRLGKLILVGDVTLVSAHADARTALAFAQTVSWRTRVVGSAVNAASSLLHVVCYGCCESQP